MKIIRTDDCNEITFNFLSDCCEYLRRYDLCVNDVEIFERKSWGIKLFIDLRMSYETILKAIIIYFSYQLKNRKEIINDIEKYRHDVKKLETFILKSPSFPKRIKRLVNCVDKKLHQIPVGLRYSYDVYDFMWVKEQLFYSTIRCDSWLYKFYRSTQALRSALENKLYNRPIEETITFGDQINPDELRKPRYSKYRNLKSKYSEK